MSTMKHTDNQQLLDDFSAQMNARVDGVSAQLDTLIMRHRTYPAFMAFQLGNMRDDARKNILCKAELMLQQEFRLAQYAFSREKILRKAELMLQQLRTNPRDFPHPQVMCDMLEGIARPDTYCTDEELVARVDRAAHYVSTL